jgi:hypothetical protein
MATMSADARMAGSPVAPLLGELRYSAELLRLARQRRLRRARRQPPGSSHCGMSVDPGVFRVLEQTLDGAAQRVNTIPA